MFHMKNLDFPQSSLKASLIGDLNHQTLMMTFCLKICLSSIHVGVLLLLLCLLLPHILPCKPVTLIDLSTINAPL